MLKVESESHATFAEENTKQALKAPSVQLINLVEYTFSEQLQDISALVYSALGLNATLSHTVECTVFWNLMGVLRDQYDNGKHVFIGSVITITGTALCAQAATCGQYMQQTWPSRAEFILNILQASARKGGWGPGGMVLLDALQELLVSLARLMFFRSFPWSYYQG